MKCWIDRRFIFEFRIIFWILGINITDIELCKNLCTWCRFSFSEAILVNKTVIAIAQLCDITSMKRKMSLIWCEIHFKLVIKLFILVIGHCSASITTLSCFLWKLGSITKDEFTTIFIIEVMKQISHRENKLNLCRNHMTWRQITDVQCSYFIFTTTLLLLITAQH